MNEGAAFLCICTGKHSITETPRGDFFHLESLIVWSIVWLGFGGQSSKVTVTSSMWILVNMMSQDALSEFIQIWQKKKVYLDTWMNWLHFGGPM